MRYVKLRPFGYTFRKRIPSKFHSLLGKSEYTFSLQTCSRVDAQIRASVLLGIILDGLNKLDNLCTESERENICKTLEDSLSKALNSFLAPTQVVHKVTPVEVKKRKDQKKSAPTLSILYAKYEKEKLTLNWSSKAAEDSRTAFQALVDILLVFLITLRLSFM